MSLRPVNLSFPSNLHFYELTLDLTYYGVFFGNLEKKQEQKELNKKLKVDEITDLQCYDTNKAKIIKTLNNTPTDFVIQYDHGSDYTIREKNATSLKGQLTTST